MITFLIIIFAVAIVMTVLGEVLGKEPFMGTNFLTYPFKIEFEKKWLQTVYRICWVVVIIALLADVILMLYPTGIFSGWGWLWLIPILPSAVCVFIPLSMIGAILIMLSGVLLLVAFDKESFQDL